MTTIDKTAAAASSDHTWKHIGATETSDAIVGAMAAGGVDHLFFTSGAEIVFYQEAIAKAKALGRPTPRMISMTHEHASLNAALGYAAVSGKPVATAAHVDAGTLNYGGAIHTARQANLPLLITAGAAPASYPGTMRGGRDAGGHIWFQQNYDQNSIVRQFVKWEHRLEFQDNAGAVVSRALQQALTEPRGPVYLSIPKEIALVASDGADFPTAGQLGIPLPTAPNRKAIRAIAERLVQAEHPFVVTSGAGRNPGVVPALVELCELLALPVHQPTPRAYLSFPMDHPLYVRFADLSECDAVLVLDAQVPWIPGPAAPGEDAYIAVVDPDPVRAKIPTYEFTADVRMNADPQASIELLIEEVRSLIGPGDAGRISERAKRIGDFTRERSDSMAAKARAHAGREDVSALWLCSQLGEFLNDDHIVMDETLPNPHNPVIDFLKCRRPGSYFNNPGTSGGWSPGAALGAKLAAPGRDVIALTGDGFYMYAAANAAILAATHYGAPFMTVIFQNRTYSTGTLRVLSTYEDSYAAKGGFEGGYFDPPIDFAKEAEAAGAYGENVRNAADVLPALERGRAATRRGQPAVISVWLPKLPASD